MQTTRNEAPARLEASAIYSSYKKSKYLSVKHSSYFQVYDELLERFRNREITFVEVGVLNGGSLFMWRDYLGPHARIIGIDFNPNARKWEGAGFEIHIGNQADPRFWDSFFSAVGDVDVILDDGGHSNEQQIVTTLQCIPHVRDKGMLIVEDTHASYMKTFGNPSRYSFINFAKRMIDRINYRFPDIQPSADSWEKVVYSMAVYQSMICFNVDREKCFVSSLTFNGGITSDAEDFRHQGTMIGKVGRLRKRFAYLEKSRLARYLYGSLQWIHARVSQGKLRKYFS